jgi:predicted methyltransferase
VTVLPVTLEEAVGSSIRTAEYQKRDIYRHPLETLKFFGIKPNMTVVEIWPSGGWYTEILAPYLASQGKYIIADPSSDPNGYTNNRKKWMEAHPDIASTVTHSVFMPNESQEIAPAHSVDAVLTFRNVHNWLPVENQEKAFKTFFKALKPGGILGVVEHRANKNKKFDPKSGYVKESEVIRMAKLAGFKLEASSEINANIKDKADHPEGVWTLPPRLRLGEKDKDKYLAIGESDRMTLKFVKPLK